MDVFKYTANIMYTIEFIKNNRKFFPNDEVYNHVLKTYEDKQKVLFDGINIFFLRGSSMPHDSS